MQPPRSFSTARLARFLLAMTATLLACGRDPLKPSQLSGLYRMTLIEGHAPPELVDTATDRPPTYLRSALLVIKSSGEDTLQARFDHGVDFLWFAWNYSGTYTITGRQLNFTTTFFDGTPRTYPGESGAEAIDVELPIPLIGTFERYEVVVKAHFEQICQGDQCSISQAATP